MAYVRFIYEGKVKGATADDIKSKLAGIDLAHVLITGTDLELIARENKDLDKAAARPALNYDPGDFIRPPDGAA
jgi:hypothetical protein